MATPPAYMSMIPMAQSKFGHHDQSFGTLANYKDFHEILDKVGSLDSLMQIDIQDEIAALYDNNQAELVIKVPTLGFTDPAFDFDLRPWFALPLSLNGFGAHTTDGKPSSSLKMIAQDFMGNKYPLLFNKEGFIDYDAIAEQSDGGLFTSLKAIYYIFSASQVLVGEGLTKLPMFSHHQGSLLMLPPEPTKKPFEVELSVIEGDHVLVDKSFEVKSTHDEIYHINQMTLKTTSLADGTKYDIHLDTNAHQTQLPSQLGLTLELPQLITQDGIVGINQTDLNYETAKFTQYFGLSDSLLGKVLEVLVPKAKMSQSFQTPTHDGFNDFSNETVMDSFYQEITQGIADSSIPIMALSDYFASAEDIKTQMRTLNIESMTKPDHDVFTELVQSMYHDIDVAYKLADSLDQMLSLDKFYPQADFSFIAQNDLDPATLDLELSITPIGGDGFSQQVYKVTPEGLINLRDYDAPAPLIDLAHEDPYFGETSIEQAATAAGQRYEISPDTLLQGAQIIHDFDWENNDVIDLSELFDNLHGAILEPSVSTQVNGDALEIWLEDSSGLGSGDKYHVVTVVGVNGSDDGMPNIEQFVEFPS